MLYSFTIFITFIIVIAKITLNTAITIIKDKNYVGSKRGHLNDGNAGHKYTFKNLIKKY